MRVPRGIVSTYHFGGLSLFDAIGGVKAIDPTISAQSHPQINVTHQPTMSVKPSEKLMSKRTPFPTSVAQVGQKTIQHDGYPIVT